MKAKLIDGPLAGTETFTSGGSVPDPYFHINQPIEKKKTKLFYKFSHWEDSDRKCAIYIYAGGRS